MTEENPAAEIAAVEIGDAYAEEITTKPEVAEPEAQDAEAEAQKTRSQERREQRKAAADRLRQEAEDAKRARDEADARLRKARETASANAAPRVDDFQDYNEYLVALGQHHALKAIDGRAVSEVEETAKAKGAQADELARRAAEELDAAWRDQFEDAKSRYADFVEVVSRATVSEDLGFLVKVNDHAAEIAYYLGQNPEESVRISGLPPLKQAYEIGRIEARLTTPKPKRVSDAPDPVSPVKAKGAHSRTGESMSYAEFCKARDEGWSPQ